MPRLQTTCVQARFSMSSAADTIEVYDELVAKLKRTAHLEGTMGLLGWDQQTMMPPGAEAARGAQQAALAGVIHESKASFSFLCQSISAQHCYFCCCFCVGTTSLRFSHEHT